MNWLAFAGSSFDVDPLPGSDIQLPPLRFLGEGLGHLDFRPVKGTESLCDLAPPASMGMMGAPAKPANGPAGAIPFNSRRLDGDDRPGQGLWLA